MIWVIIAIVVLVVAVGGLLVAEGGWPYGTTGSRDPYWKVVKDTSGLVAWWPLAEQRWWSTARDIGREPALDDDGYPPPEPAPIGDHSGLYERHATPPLAQSAPAMPAITLYEQPSLVGGTRGDKRRSIYVSGGYVGVRFDHEINTPKFSIEVWARPDWPADAAAAYRYVIGACTTRATPIIHGTIAHTVDSPPEPETVKRGFMLYANPHNHWEARVGTGSAWVSTIVQGDPIDLYGTSYLVLTYDGEILALYVDTTAAAAVSTSFYPNTGAPLYIGYGGSELPTPVAPFQGWIGDAAYYDRALTPKEIVHHGEAAGVL
jgi:hypothetical protein